MKCNPLPQRSNMEIKIIIENVRRDGGMIEEFIEMLSKQKELHPEIEFKVEMHAG